MPKAAVKEPMEAKMSPTDSIAAEKPSGDMRRISNGFVITQMQILAIGLTQQPRRRLTIKSQALKAENL